MLKKQLILGLRLKILFIIFMLSGLTAGCVTNTAVRKEAGKEEKASRGIMDDVLVFRDLQQIDLDNDGLKEIVAIYASRLNSSGVKVIKFYQESGEVIFERLFNTPNARFEVKKGVPTVYFEETDASGRTLKGVYRWDGKTFVLER